MDSHHNGICSSTQKNRALQIHTTESIAKQIHGFRTFQKLVLNKSSLAYFANMVRSPEEAIQRAKLFDPSPSDVAVGGDFRAHDTGAGTGAG